jgi:radical SAM protein with 4Fe4S-binding SPASM domain
VKELIQKIKNEEKQATVCGVAKSSPLKDRKMGSKGWEYFPLFWICLYLSYKCTRKCSYCYSHMLKGDSAEMTDDNFNRVVELIPQVYHETYVRSMLVVFLGGEPLLRTDRIKRILDSIRTKTPGMGTSIFTNGDLVDAVDWNDLAGITIWNMNVTDTPLAELERRMSVVAQNARPQNQSVVITLDDFNMHENRAEELVSFAIENDYRPRIYRSLYRSQDKEYRKNLLAKYHSILDVCEKKQSQGYNLHIQFMIDQLMPFKWENVSENFTPYICGRRLLAIRADGTIGSCIRAHAQTVGNIYSDNITDLIRDSRFRVTHKRPDAPEECKLCEVRDICNGGCPNDRLVAYGNFKGKNPWCSIIKEIIPRLMALQEYKHGS